MKPGLPLRGHIIYETVASLRLASGEVVVTPLGVAPEPGGALRATIYPGTRLSRAPEAYEACLTATSSPESFALATRGVARATRPARAVSAPCVEGEAYIEAVVASRERLWWGATRLRLEPVAYWAEEPPKPYTRLLGCSIEALIAATRVEYWSRQRPQGCGEAQRHAAKAAEALHCAAHIAGGTPPPSVAAVVTTACRRALARGCPLTCPEPP